MPRIKNTSEERIIKSLAHGHFSRKRNPSPIKYYSLTGALKKVSWYKLAKELAFCLSTSMSYRLATEDRYRIAFNVIPSINWEEVCVIQLHKDIKSFSDLICINIKEYNDSFIENNIKFTSLVLAELNTIRRS